MIFLDLLRFTLLFRFFAGCISGNATQGVAQ
jgi:hypothetical protein